MAIMVERQVFCVLSNEEASLMDVQYIWLRITGTVAFQLGWEGL